MSGFAKADGGRPGGPVVLITGSSGAVGDAIAAMAETAGWVVRGVDVVSGPRTHLVGDLRDPRIRRRAVDGADVVVHVAALHAPHVGRVPDTEFRSVNVDLTEDVLAEAASRGASRVVYTSSTSVYGHALVPDGRAVWVDEHLAPRPRDVYDETKLAAEALVASSPVPAVTLRIARCFPEPLEILARHRLHRGVALPDVAAAHVLAVRSTVTGTYNVAGPLLFEPADVGQLYSDAASVLRRRHPAIAAAFAARGWPLPRRLDRVYDSRAALGALGYQPRHDVLGLLDRSARC
jgi:nucleoside-diphosphate-sugar epimerase